MVCIFKYIFIFGFFLYLFPICQSPIHAADFKSQYNVDYYLYENNGHPFTKVKFKVDITSFTTQSFISKFSLSFPKYFKITNPTALYNEPLIPDIQTDDKATILSLHFPEVHVGKDITNTIYVDFDQDNLFKINGSSWEVLLPTLSTDLNENYQITLHLPENSQKKMTISKPDTGITEGNTITWKNPQTKIIYAVFGDKEFYDLNVTYNLENSDFKNGYIDVAFPPDTQNQKVYINALNEKPKQVTIDSDGNYLARYYVQPHQQKKIVLSATVELSQDAREQVQQWNKNQLEYQKNYLLNATNLWDINIKNSLHSSKDIYSYINNTLSYNYNRVTKNIQRLGAAEALKNPDQAVCTEFTDVFIALARQKGIYSREIEGYGYADNPHIRPVSTDSDILHSWPEYYDIPSNRWIEIDPTWENTSGIDYFNSLDLNHIAFAIHGKDSVYPLPAGMYKTNDSKDVIVTLTKTQPVEKVDVHLSSIYIPSQLNANSPATATIEVENTGNTYVWSIPVKIDSPVLKIQNPDIIIPELAPFQRKQLDISFTTPQTSTSINTEINFSILGKNASSKKVTISPYYFNVAAKTASIIFGIFFIGLGSQLFFKNFFKK